MNGLVAGSAGRVAAAATWLPYRRYLASLRRPEAAQRAALARVLADTAGTEHGRHHGLNAGDGPAAFADRVPLVGYEDLRPWVDAAIDHPGSPVLSRHPVVRTVLTSGSSSAAAKRIPYNRPMLRTFSRMFSLWAHDLLRSGLYRPATGKLFLCVTGDSVSAGGGGDDREFLSAPWRAFLSRFVTVPAYAREARPLGALASALGAGREIEVMSFWSPSLLLAALREMGIGSAAGTRRMWPRLQLISCWTSGSAARFTAELRELFPTVAVQGKGLLATEAAVTLPLGCAGGCVPLLDDVYLEFIESGGEGGTVRPLHELEPGGIYQTVVTTRAGFLRYKTGDRVTVTGTFGGSPVLAFAGRAGVVSDLVGEKLSLGFVSRELDEVLPDRYFCLLPSGDRYVLWVDASGGGGEPVPASDVDGALRKNPHYDHAVRLGQLRPAEVAWCHRLDEAVYGELAASGRAPAAGAFKPPALITDPELASQVNRGLLQRRLRANGG